jgi:hypothetical protein
MCARLLLLLLLHQPISPSPAPTFYPQNLHQPPQHQEVFNVNFGAWFSLHPILHWNVVMRVGHFSCGHFEYLKFLGHSKCQLVYLLLRHIDGPISMAYANWQKFREFEMRNWHWTLNIGHPSLLTYLVKVESKWIIIVMIHS